MEAHSQVADVHVNAEESCDETVSLRSGCLVELQHDPQLDEQASSSSDGGQESEPFMHQSAVSDLGDWKTLAVVPTSIPDHF